MFFSQLYIERETISKMLSQISSMINTMPSGRLRIDGHRKKPLYYHVSDCKNPSGKYLKQEQFPLAQQLAQKEYYLKMQSECASQLKLIDDFLSSYNPNCFNQVYDSLSTYRKEIVHPLVVSDSEYINQWLNSDYDGNPFSPEEKRYATKQGEYVRSKSEAMIADMYYEMGIPYKYECPLTLAHRKRYPDFTLLDISSRQEVYHEHLGLLDDSDYIKHNLGKIKEYAENNIFLGTNLLITVESSNFPFNIRLIEKQVKKFMKIN